MLLLLALARERARNEDSILLLACGLCLFVGWTESGLGLGFLLFRSNHAHSERRTNHIRDLRYWMIEGVLIAAVTDTCLQSRRCDVTAIELYL